MTDLAPTVVPARYLMSAPPFTPTPKPEIDEGLRGVLTVTREQRDGALAEVDRLRTALRPFARVANSDTVQSGGSLILSNGKRMVIVEAKAFTDAAELLAGDQ